MKPSGAATIMISLLVLFGAVGYLYHGWIGCIAAIIIFLLIASVTMYSFEREDAVAELAAEGEKDEPESFD